MCPFIHRVLALFLFATFLPCFLALPHDDQWIEKADVRLPLGLLDESLSLVAPGVKAGSKEEAEVLGTTVLSAQLDAVNPMVDLKKGDDNFLVLFTIFNPSDKDVKICQRDTPLEGLWSKLFVVKNPAGKEMAYRGKDIKRTERCGVDEHVTIPAGKSLSKRSRISGRYALEGDGLYYIRVRQPMNEHLTYTDVMRTYTTIFVTGSAEHEERFQAAVKAQTAKKLADAGTGAVSYNGCSSSQQAELLRWHEDARDKIFASKACTESSCGATVDTWFGSQTTNGQFVAGAVEQFNTMARVMDSSGYVCEGGMTARQGNVCGGSTYAFVYPSDTTQKIYICDFTFNYPDYSEKVQTVIHELSHFNHIGNTNDNAYGESTCMSLAQQDFQRAIQTADNVGYFGKYINQCYRENPSYTPPNAPAVGCSDRYSNCGSLASSGCAGRTLGDGSSMSTSCCRSCTGTPANNCGGAPDPQPGGGSGPTPPPAPSPPAPSPPAPSPPAPSPSGSGTDQYSNCPDMVAANGCNACCITGTQSSVRDVCGASCASGSAPSPPAPSPPAPSPPAPSSCPYENDGECDVPSYCPAGTDTADCAGASPNQAASSSCRRRRSAGLCATRRRYTRI